MAMSVGPSEGDDAVMSAINTTPLVDVMLVLLIIFLLTIPVVTKQVEVTLPTVTNEALITKPENITLSVDKKGNYFWNGGFVKPENFANYVANVASAVPQPEIHIRADKDTRYEFVGRAVATCQKAGILKVGFITDPELRGVNF